MRLIDADLFPKFHVCCGETEHQIGFDEGIEYMLDEIHDAPTVNAILVNHGRWVKATGYMPSEYFGRHMCSVCEHFAPNYLSNGEWLSPVCPSCGAIMDKNK